MDVLADVREGRQIVYEGKLKPLRESLGLTRSAMAELLNTTVFTYSSWEKNTDTTLWPDSATRVGRFYRNASQELELLKVQGVDITKLMPLFAASTLLGVPQEILMMWYRDGHFEGVDLGILGLWIFRRDMKLIRQNQGRKLRSVGE